MEKHDYLEKIKQYRDMEIRTLESLDLDAINTVINVLEDARKRGAHIFVCGNGGSAATASHYAGDFNKGVNMGLAGVDSYSNHGEPSAAGMRAACIPFYNFECLSDNQPAMLAVANDEGYEEVFRYPLSVKMKEGDVVIGISGSGNSANVVNALRYCNEYGGKSVAIVGYDGGKMKQMADYCIHVNINDMQVSEDIHMILDHLMMWALTYGCAC